MMWKIKMYKAPLNKSDQRCQIKGLHLLNKCWDFFEHTVKYTCFLRCQGRVEGYRFMNAKDNKPDE